MKCTKHQFKIFFIIEFQTYYFTFLKSANHYTSIFLFIANLTLGKRNICYYRDRRSQVRKNICYYADADNIVRVERTYAIMLTDVK